MAQGPDRHPDPLDERGAETPAAIRAAIAETRREMAHHLSALRNRLLDPPLQTADSPTEPSMLTQKKSTSKAKATTKAPAKGGAADKVKTAKAEMKAVASPTKAKSASPKASATPKKSASSPATKTKPAASSSATPKSANSTKSAAKAKTATKPKAKAATKPKAKPQGIVSSLVGKTGVVIDTMLAGAVVGAVTGAARSVSQEPAAVTSGGGVSSIKSDSPGTGEVLGEMAPGAARRCDVRRGQVRPAHREGQGLQEESLEEMS